MNLVRHRYLRLIPAIYFLSLGIFSIVMELSHSGLSLIEFCIYAALLLPIFLPVKFVWTTFGLLLSFIFGLALLNAFVWLTEYLNGAYFKYPFDTFAIGFPFIVWTLLCAMSLCYMGLTSPHKVLKGREGS